MRIAVLSDVHGNAVALDACLARVDRLRVDARVFLGDVVGYLPDEVRCLRALRREGFECQQGNHEAMLLSGSAPGEGEAVYRLQDARRRLAADELRGIADWPVRRTLARDGVRLLFVHGTPDDPLEGCVHPDTDLSGWDRLPFDGVLTGHTHRPFARRSGPVLVANAGSVGLPRDTGCLASFAVLDCDGLRCTHFRVPFDVEAAVRRAGPALHPAVRACLRRRAGDVVGEVLA
jgi:predicted phosphodiesterase